MALTTGALAGLAFGAAIGILLSVLGCVLYKNYWGLFSLFTFLFAPLPSVLCSGSDIYSSQKTGWSHMGDFLTGLFAASGVAISLVLLHIDVIPLGSMFLALSGGAVLFFTGTLGFKLNSSD